MYPYVAEAVLLSVVVRGVCVSCCTLVTLAHDIALRETAGARAPLRAVVNVVVCHGSHRLMVSCTTAQAEEGAGRAGAVCRAIAGNRFWAVNP